MRLILLQLPHCVPCWQGKSLRGHLRGNNQCKAFYDLDELERDANKIKRLQKAEWGKKQPSWGKRHHLAISKA